MSTVCLAVASICNSIAIIILVFRILKYFKDEGKNR